MSYNIQSAETSNNTDMLTRYYAMTPYRYHWSKTQGTKLYELHSPVGTNRKTWTVIIKDVDTGDTIARKERFRKVDTALRFLIDAGLTH